MSKKSFSTTNQNIVFIDASKKNNQNNDCENSNFQISPNCPNFNVKNNDDMPFENKLKSNEAKESQETLNIKKISEMEKEKQLVMKEKELIEKEKALNMKEKALNMKEKEMREKIEKEFREKEILKKEEKKEKKI